VGLGRQTVLVHSEVKRPLVSGDSDVEKVYRRRTSITSETRLMKLEHEVKIGKTEISMITWMCGFMLKERNNIAEIRALL